jgi:tRNA A-37 threonylcarbamoyl transferase component Bud32
MRFVFSPPAESATGLLTLPWQEPLSDWSDDRMAEMRQRGISRHVVRFVAEGADVYALKEINEDLARREYRLLREVAEMGLPAVEVLGVVVDRGEDMDAILVTRFLEYSVSYRSLFSTPRGGAPAEKLLDAMVELIVRLHLAGFFWGDCSLSNTLFRLDAGALAAYLVDTETSELHASLSEGQRYYDLELARERVGGEMLDLEAGEVLPPDVDAVEFADELVERYERLWDELTREEVLRPEEQRYRIGERIRRLNELGFDVDELELIATGDGSRLKMRTRVAEPGHFRKKLFARTGLDVQENQARRLWGDLASFRAYLEQKEGRPVAEAVAANRWLTEVYDPILAAIPPRLRGRLDPAEIFHEILEHRWFLSEAAGRDVGTTAAARSYFSSVLPAVPEQLTSGDMVTARLQPDPAAPA